MFHCIRAAANADLRQICELDFEAFSTYGTTESPDIIAARLYVFPDGFIVVAQDNTISVMAAPENGYMCANRL